MDGTDIVADFCKIFVFEYFLKNLSRKFKFLLKPDQTNVYFTLRPMYFLIISHSFPLRMRNVSGKICRVNQNTHFGYSNFLFENRTVYEIMWEKNTVQRGRNTDSNMAHAQYIPDT
jgi:hypothetical protein